MCGKISIHMSDFNMFSWESLPPIAIRVQWRVDHLLAECATLCDRGLVVLDLRAHQGLPPSIANGRRGVHLSCGQHLVWTNIHVGIKQREIVFINPT